MGCIIGGIMALGCLALQVTSVPWWLAMIGAGVWMGMHVQVGTHGVGYVGTQAVIGFIVTMIQGAAPPNSIMPGVDRFAGILGGFFILMVVSLVLRPSDEKLKESAGAGSEQR